MNTKNASKSIHRFLQPSKGTLMSNVPSPFK